MSTRVAVLVLLGLIALACIEACQRRPSSSRPRRAREVHRWQAGRPLTASRPPQRATR